MKLLPAASCKVMPWKNGLGRTTEIARSASLPSEHGFDWRVSVAQVSGPGPFSRFSGVDRCIVQLSGPPMTLQFSGEGREKTLARLVPYYFAGETPIHADVAGPGTDFNVMVRRAAWEQEVACLPLEAAGTRGFDCAGALLLLYCVEGGFGACWGGDVVQAGPKDSVLIDGMQPGRLTVTAHAQGATVLAAVMKPRRRTAGA